MVNYALSKIYKLVNSVDGRIYVGSTASGLARRKSVHKAKSSSNPNRKVYAHLNQVGWGNVDIVLVESYECKNKDELHARERYWMETLHADLNSISPHNTPEEKIGRAHV